MRTTGVGQYFKSMYLGFDRVLKKFRINDVAINNNNLHNNMKISCLIF